jgi:hypothetical protein
MLWNVFINLQSYIKSDYFEFKIVTFIQISQKIAFKFLFKIIV